MLGQVGIPGIIILLVICLIAFGSKNLPNIGRSLGESLQEFKRGISGLKEVFN
ncbi:twin-arginine translocase TatA/TatE family subunit [Bacillaceae bacterium CLA-AA-H227]|uniref:Twin-arginine translocase TatA/TatE family subunit n=1 Tax=Robertmurraya yapensis (ex Hitch et al 2024) TaxID=3133160 RepID=A0ACC6SBW5_9BACI